SLAHRQGGGRTSVSATDCRKSDNSQRSRGVTETSCSRNGAVRDASWRYSHFCSPSLSFAKFLSHFLGAGAGSPRSKFGHSRDLLKSGTGTYNSRDSGRSDRGKVHRGSKRL